MHRGGVFRRCQRYRVCEPAGGFAPWVAVFGLLCVPEYYPQQFIGVAGVVDRVVDPHGRRASVLLLRLVDGAVVIAGVENRLRYPVAVVALLGHRSLPV